MTRDVAPGVGAALAAAQGKHKACPYGSFLSRYSLNSAWARSRMAFM